MHLPPEHTDLAFPFDDAGCFGCSSLNEGGLRLRFRRRGDEIYATYRIADRFHGAPGIAHGGIVATILDEFCCAAAVFLRDTRVMTGELTVRYEAPCPVEHDVEVSARITDEGHPRYLVVEGEIRDGEQRLCRSTGKFFPSPVGEPRP